VEVRVRLAARPLLSYCGNLPGPRLDFSVEHSFTGPAAQFASVEYNDQQVDDGTYRLLDARTSRINDGTFQFRVKGRELRLKPVISAAARRKALAQPLQFSTAGWQVAVAFPGHAWKRVPCAQWC